MEITEYLPGEEIFILELRKLFQSRGYRKYRMGTLEEYDLYADNRAFLTTESIITFQDARGRLMALKPDVTLSIVKNSRAPKCGERLYYLENVYRLQPGGEYKEIAQMGLECIGGVDRYTTLEVLSLALESLRAAGRPYLLELSHMGLVEALLGAQGVSRALLPAALSALSKKSEQELAALACAAGLSPEQKTRLASLARTGGPLAQVLPELRQLCNDAPDAAAALEELETLEADLSALGLDANVRLDLSTVNSIDYYTGIIFRGYLDGVPRAVLSGGRYDKLMERFDKSAGALGFALYLNELGRVFGKADDYDADVLLLYGPADAPAEVFSAAQALGAQGKRVSVRPEMPEGYRCRQVIRLGENGQEVYNA